MVRLPIRPASALLALGTWGALMSADASAQAPRRNEIRISPFADGEERASQPKLWVLEVYMKPMRLIPVELTDPTTGEKKLEYVWYITYRAVHRKSVERTDPEAPENQFDEPVSPPLFIPEFTLVVTDNDRHEEYTDQVIPEALAAINKREKGNYKSSVGVVGPLPEANDPGAGYDHAIQGVAMWKGIDPDADRYTVYMTGFSNGYRKFDGPDGTPVVQTKTIRQRYWRKGDRFEQNEAEIELTPFDVVELMQTLDKDKDKKISKEEATGSPVAGPFESIDVAPKDDVLTNNELEAFFNAAWIYR
jgi:hypothetical protein